MTKEPFIAHSELTNEIYIVVGKEKYCVTEQAIKAVVAIKALGQKPRKGHWNTKDKMWWVCSACGCQTRMMKKYNVPNFCPACGADMRMEEI